MIQETSLFAEHPLRKARCQCRFPLWDRSPPLNTPTLTGTWPKFFEILWKRHTSGWLAQWSELLLFLIFAHGRERFWNFLHIIMSFSLLRNSQIMKEIISHSASGGYEVKLRERLYPTCHCSPGFSVANKHLSLHIKLKKKTKQNQNKHKLDR